MNEVTHETLREWPLPAPGSEKHRRGVVLVVAGSASTPGSALLSGEAALRAGAGKLKVACAASVAPALGVALPEAGVRGFDEAASGDVTASAADDVRRLAENADAVLAGPGWLDPDDAAAFLSRFVPGLESPLVLDALASAYVERHPDEVAGCILAMNPSELAHALDVPVDDVEHDQATAVTTLSKRTGAVVLCGGESKVVGTPDGSLHLVRPSGPGLAVSGSGDVQAGLVVGLLARGAEADQAAVWGAWLHANAGQRVAARVGPLGFLARELAGEVPGLLRDIV